ncbi:MAG: hypothetical protein V1778_03835 [bacterium]
MTAIMLRLVRVLSIREFYSLNEEAVEENLTTWKRSLGLAYEIKDGTRRDATRASSWFPNGVDPTGYWDWKLREADRRVANRQRGYDFARGLAYLMGHGKIVDRISR